MAEGEAAPANLGWWTIHGSTLLTALHDAHDGENPELVYAELYANAEVHSADPEDDD